MRANTKKKQKMGKRFAVLIGVAAVGVMALGAQTGAQTQAPTPRGQAPPTCNGLAATIVGTEGTDRLFGTSGQDVIVAGGGGRDQVWGFGGNDTLCGEAGKDELDGDRGNDTLNGGNGNDALLGGTGKDKLNGGKGKDKCGGGGISSATEPPDDTVKDTGKSCEKEKLIP
jgi:Ca2+-binding RTX toxin-like protein